jgi:hypothetical protein
LSPSIFGISLFDVYLRPLNKQGIINSTKSVLNGKENLFYPSNARDKEELSISMLLLTEYCRLIVNQPFDEKNVLIESFRTIIEQRSKEGDSKYKIIDIDGSELSISDLIEKYFFSKIHYTSCSVILQRFHNNSIEHYSIAEGQTTKNDKEEEEKKNDELDSVNASEKSDYKNFVL